MQLEKIGRRHFTIDRSFWRRGASRLDLRPHGYTELHNKLGNACCLGHIAQQCGVTWAELTGTTMPGELSVASRAFLYGVLIDNKLDESDRLPNPDIAAVAASINDSITISDEVREAEITALFAESGITLTFHGEYLGGYLGSRSPLDKDGKVAFD